MPTVPTSYVVAGTGDFNGDGTFDLVWREPSSGTNSIWYIANGTFAGGGIGLTTVPNSYSIVGIGDFDGDGGYDLLWRNASTGENSIWLIKKGFLGGIGLPNVSGSALQVVAPR